MTRTASFVASLLIASAAHAQLIDFETTPAGVAPLDDAPVATPYALVGGGTVEFFFDANLNNVFDVNDTRPLYEAAGADGTDGFANGIVGVPDTAAPGFAGQLGNWFARQPVSGSVPPPFVIDYATSQTITALAGEIWDIDGTAAGTERWLVEVLDAGNVPLASQLSPLGASNAMDATPWTLAFTGLPTGVDKVRISFVGTKTMGLGLAFNNFQPTTAPEPAGLTLLAAAVGAGLRRRRRVGRWAAGAAAAVAAGLAVVPASAAPAVSAATAASIDSDADGVADLNDNAPGSNNPSQADADGDQIGDPIDPTPLSPGPWVTMNFAIGGVYTVAPGAGVTINYTLGSPPVGNYGHVELHLQPGPNPPDAYAFQPLHAPGGTFSIAANLVTIPGVWDLNTPGVYTLAATAVGPGAPGGSFGGTATVVVVAPEPAGLTLLAVASLGLRRRRGNAAAGR